MSIKHAGSGQSNDGRVVKQSLDVLRRHFAELFEPLRQISDFTQDLADIKDSLNNLSDDVHKKINDLTDALDPDQIRKNLRHLVQARKT